MELRIWLLHVLLLCSMSSFGQIVGKVTYLEGKTEVFTDQWILLEVGVELDLNARLRTGNNGIIEIEWGKGGRCTVESAAEYRVKDLAAIQAPSNRQGVESLLSRLRRMLGSERSNLEEAGVRRSEVDVATYPGPDEMYWKKEEEMSFTAAVRAYDRNEFSSAVRDIETWLRQHQGDERERDMLYRLGRSYYMLNNHTQAKKCFERYVRKYPADSMTSDLKLILEEY